MNVMIQNGGIVDDPWQVLRLAADVSAASVVVPDQQPVLVPLAVWQLQRAVLLDRARGGTLGVWLAPEEQAQALAEDAKLLQVIGVDFPAFTDGRGYSTAALLRTRYGYTHSLRAIGDVLRDQFQAYVRCGFDTLVPPPGKYSRSQLEAALSSLAAFTWPYQGDIVEPRPLWRRVERGQAA